MKISRSWLYVPLIVLMAGFAVALQVNLWRKQTVFAQRASLLVAAGRYPNFTLAQRMAILQEMQAERHASWRDLSAEEIARRLLQYATASASTAAAPPAAFQGNLTAIDAPPGDAIGMGRQANCSLTAEWASYTLTLPNVSYDPLGTVANYDQVLHKEAGLTTTGGNWPSGCGDPILGITSRKVVPLGMTTSGLVVGAGAGYNAALGEQLIYTGAGNPLLASTLSPGEIAISGAEPLAVAAADLNGDGNTDLVAISNPASTGNSASVSVLLGDADGSFQNPVTYILPGQSAGSVVIDDFNGDGILDLIASSFTESTSNGLETFAWQLTFFAGKGDGTFQPPLSVTVAPPASVTGTSLAYTGLISADVLGNRKKGLVTEQGIVLLGNGNGTFTQVATPAFSGSTSNGGLTGVAAADFNKDGKLDLAVDDGGSIAIYLGNGDGTFTAGNAYASISNTGALNATDLDGDGNQDLYSGTAKGGYFGGDQFAIGQGYALMGLGNGSFAGAPLLPFAFTGLNLVPLSTSSKTLAGFGLNAALNSTISFTAYLSNSNGTFSTGPTTTVSPVTIGGITYTSAGLGSFAFGDFNGDGKTDMVFTVGGLTASSGPPPAGYFVSMGNGDGTFNTTILDPLPNFVPGGAADEGASMVNLMVADVNGDGKPDLIYNYSDIAYASQILYAGIAVQLSNGDGTFQAPLTIQTYSGPTGVAGGYPILAYIGSPVVGGKPGLFAIQETISTSGDSAKLLMYPGNGDGTFGAATTPPVADNITLPGFGSAVGQMVLADMNGDGKPDLITLGTANNGNQAELAISLGNGDGTFNTPTILDFGDGGSLGYSLAVADFNGDGKLDVAVGGLFPPVDTGIFFGNGDGTVQSFPSGSMVEPAQAINFPGFGAAMAADINGDGKPDLILGGIVLINDGVSTSALTSTTTALTASAATITVGQSVTFTSTVTAASTPSGTVTFYDGTTTLGTGALNNSGVATYSTTSLAAGSHSITASYGGNSAFAASTSAATIVTVSAPALTATTTALTVSAATVDAGASVSFSVTVTPSSGTGTPTGTVAFMEGTTALGTGTLSGGAASYSTSSLATGADSISAVYGGDSNFAGSTSAAVVVTVEAVTPSFAIADSPSSAAVTAGQSAQTTIAVTPNGGFSQQVSFACAGLPMGGSCTFSPTTVTPSGSAATTTLTIATAVQSASLARPGQSRSGTTMAFAMLAGGFLWCFRRRRYLGSWSRLHLAILLLLTVAAATVGCGGGSSSSTGSKGTSPQTYSVTITGTAGSESQSAAYSLTVQ